MARGGIITLYVGNLPEKLHWCGLRQAFGRHGDLVDAYIAKKLDRQGKLFGFDILLEKKKVVPQSLNQSRAEGIGERNVAIESQKLEEAGKVAVNGNNGGCKKISGFVDNETLWMLIRLIHKGAGDDSKKEPVRSESIDSSSSSSSTTPRKMEERTLPLVGIKPKHAWAKVA
ncbi:hypothetical protein V6N11_059519 [Hibiscus sabdariffa]|uniref:RRM domain-containing protein n=1 Tax=Hibiscus sabdariffa TaxID=183260 RepID=A0ABR2ACK5_9ROSI